MSILSRITGRQHHFKILLTYRPIANKERPFVTTRLNVWLQDRSLIADDRKVKKAVAETMLKDIPKQLKRNGTLEVSEVYYLGWFKPLDNKPQKSLIERWLENYFLYLALKGAELERKKS
ncbi:hypothetical protein MYE70_10345 [Marinobacter alexandrii]|uniref:hypothetical protein n=1 Tax=Marinobacter alexandrii TaxID=2570351 RepID=UPI001FFF75FB|nr:hypothetical protein [Marinobacter alexandrii]MCK2149465.1 hypothetical protein [Marinobacter alexandrii]